MSATDLVHREDDTTAPVPVRASEGAAILSMIERAARDPSIDIDRMERMMQMHRQMRQEAAEQAFNEAMGKAQAEMPRVLRDAKNTHTKSSYARLETINKAITPIITKHGFALSFGTEQSPVPGHYRITCKVSHQAGHSRDEHADLPADVAGAQGNANKTAIQGFGSTLSYGRRYMTLLIFNVALTNEDDDGAGPLPEQNTISPEQVQQLQDLIIESGADPVKFLEAGNIAKLSDMLATDFGRAMAALRRRAAKGAK